MELLEAFTIFGVLGVVLASIILVIFRLFPQKTTKKALDKTIIAQNQTIIEQSEFIKARYENQLRSVQKMNRDLQAELYPTDEEGNTIQKEVPWEVIAAGAQQMGIPPLMLMPFKKQILKATKGMSIEEIQQMANASKGQLAGLLKGGQSQSTSEGEFGTFKEETLR